MHYKTRHLEAVVEVHHNGRLYHAGEALVATPVDADYLVARGKARNVAPKAAQPSAPPAAHSALTERSPAPASSPEGADLAADTPGEDVAQTETRTRRPYTRRTPL